MSRLTLSKEEAIKSFLNQFLQDETLYCNHCGMIYTPCPVGCVETPCCDKPQIGNNKQILEAFALEQKRIRQTRLNEYASNKQKNFRLSLSFPPRLMHDLEQYCMNELKEPLFREDGSDLNDFMRAFPIFCVPEKV